MFVRDQNPVECFGVDARGSQALKSLLLAETCVDQEPRPAGGNEGRIARTGRGENGNLKDRALLIKRMIAC
jgi:hypothetical protein